MSRDIQHRADRLYETLQSELDRFVVSQRFFSIRELIRRHRVSRRIVEKVLARLEKEEQIRIEPARGIFVCERRRNTRIITSVHYDWPAEYLQKLDTAIEKEVKAHPGWVFSRAFFSPDSEIRFVEFLKKVPGDAILLILPFFRLGQQAYIRKALRHARRQAIATMVVHHENFGPRTAVLQALERFQGLLPGTVEHHAGGNAGEFLHGFHPPRLYS